ncbi:MAG: DUF58 domain-containing protein [Pseudomonadota bacterium]|nr:DUF58 domain-containing protein [Pseudomonadota bacterium]
MDTGFSRRVAGLTRVIRRPDVRWRERKAEKRTPVVGKLQLGQRTIYILPTIQGALFALGATTILLVGFADRNPITVVLATAMLSLFLLSLVLCYRNLSGLTLQASEATESGNPSARCFAGEQASFMLTLSAAGRRRAHRDLLLGFSPKDGQPLEVAPGAVTSATLTAPAEKRGLMAAPRLHLRTRYPAGLWQAWSRPDLAMHCLVYPRPQQCSLPPSALRVPAHTEGQQSGARKQGVDDFLGLRSYQSGDSRRLIAWRSLARGQGLKTKQFAQEADPEVHLSFESFKGRETEDILGCLSFQVLQLSQQQKRIGMTLPATQVGDEKSNADSTHRITRPRHIKADQGEAHKHSLLQALALWA